jgi:hypothetical protein
VVSFFLAFPPKSYIHSSSSYACYKACPFPSFCKRNRIIFLNYAFHRYSEYENSEVHVSLPDLTIATFFLSCYPHQNEEPIKAEDLRKYYTFPSYSEVCLDLSHDFPSSPIHLLFFTTFLFQASKMRQR